MHLPSSKNIKVYSAIAAGIVILILLVNLQIQKDKTPGLKDAGILMDNWKLEEAEKTLEEITSVKNPSDSALKLFLRILFLRGKYLKAEALFNRHFSNSKNIQTEVILDFADINHFLGKIQKSDSLCNVVIHDSIRSHSLKNFSRALNIIGLNKFFQAEYDSALLYQQKSLLAAKSSAAQKEEADALRQIGVLAWYRGELDSALHNYYEPALNIYRSINDKHGEATTLSDIGLLYFDWKNWTKEFFYQLKALTIRREIGDLMGIADSYNFLEHFPKLTKELELMKYELINKSYKISKELGYKWGVEIASNSMQQFFRRNYELFGNFPFNPDSITYSSAEAKLFQLINNKLFVVNGKKNREETLKIYKEILRIANSMDYAVIQCNTLVSLAGFYMEDDRLKEATEALDSAIQFSESSAQPKFHFASINILKAKLEFKIGNQQSGLRKLKKLAHYYDSLYISESNRARTGLEWQSSLYSIYNHRNWTYSILLDLLFEANDYDEFLIYTEKEKSLINWYNSNGKFFENKNGFVNLFEKLISIESINEGDSVIDSLLNLFENLIDSQNERLNRVSRIPKSILSVNQSIPSFQKRLGGKEIFIDFSQGEKYFYVAGISNDNISIKKIPIPQDNLCEVIFFFQRSIERGRWNPKDAAWETPAAYLYAKLLKPILKNKEFEGKNKIIISPQNVLHQIPFAALLINSDITNDKTKMIDKFSISYSYSRENYAGHINQPINKFHSILAFAPDNDELKFSEKEISLLPTSLFEVIKTFIGRQATKKNFVNNVNNYDFIHIASHSQIDIMHPLQSQIKFNDGFLELLDVIGQHISAELVVLSSCESGMSTGTIRNIPTSLDLISFPQVLLASGTKSVLSTLWLVDDYSTAGIISRFYQNLATQKMENKIDLTEALSDAIRNFISSQKDKNHPFYWAPFVISY